MLSWRCSVCCASLQAPQNSSEYRRGPEGRLHQLSETLSESGPPSLLHEGRAPNPQVLCCIILLTTESALRRLLSSDQRAPAAEGRVVTSPEERDLHSPLVTAHSVLLFSHPRPISRFIRGNGGQDPQNLHGPFFLSQCIQDAPQFPQSSLFALSLLRSYRESLSVTRAKPLVSSRRASYPPPPLPPRSPPQKSCI